MARNRLGALIACVALAQACGAAPDARSAAEAKARALIAQMTLDEKVGQLVNRAPAISRLGIPAYNWWTESLHGALGPVATTNFPEPIGLAATFDAPLIGDVAAAIGSEVGALHRLGRDTGHIGTIGGGLDSWSPNINIFRDPRWGRGQETYGEDPFLTATLAVAFVGGLQGPDPDRPRIVATPKHFAVHSGPEQTRHSADIFVSAHDLEDTYLPAFRAAIVEGKAGSIMCAYNRIDGQPACASDLLLNRRLRGAWGFEGYVVSDCDAVVDIAEHHHYAPDPAAAVATALKAGTDNECNTKTMAGATDLGERYKAALARGLIAGDDLDRALVRLFSARFRTGDLPGLTPVTPDPTAEAIGSPAHQALALRAAIESMVLLKNDGTLPLRPTIRIALVGPLADATRVLRGNYSSPQSAWPISVLAGLRRAMPGAQIEAVPFSASITDGDPVPPAAFVTPDGRPGLRVDYFNPPPGTAGSASAADDRERPVVTRVEPDVAARAGSLPAVNDRHRVRWSGFLVAPETGTYRIALTGVTGTVTVDGQSAISATHYSRWSEPLALVDVTLRQGQRYPLRLASENGVSSTPGIFWKRVSPAADRALVEAAARADVIVAVVGLTSDLEGEEMPVQVEGFAGGDRTSLDLPADQRAMLERAATLGKPLIMVTMNGGAINLAWAKAHAAAILEAWYPGQAGGRAVAEILGGTANPGGRLPLTFYRSVDDLPPFDDYAMTGRTYRYFAGTPVYRFGDGLSYTSFAYAPLVLRPAAGGVAAGLSVSTEVRNSGGRAGEEVAQLYLTFPALPGVPRIALRGFRRIALAPGERRRVTFDLTPRALSAVTAEGRRLVMAGTFQVGVGSGQPGPGVAGQSAVFVNRREAPLPE